MRPNKIVAIAKTKGVSVEKLLTDLYDRHGTQVGVASELGISQGRVSQVLKDLKLKEKTILIKSDGAA